MHIDEYRAFIRVLALQQGLDVKPSKMDRTPRACTIDRYHIPEDILIPEILKI